MVRMTKTNTTKNGALLVTGASGHLGKAVVELLLARADGRPIIATTRTPEKLADLNARGVDVRAADFDDEASLVAAFAGAERLLLVSTDALDRPGHRIAQHRAAVRAAAKAGVKHIVYTSLPNPGPESPVTLAPDHRETEAAITASGLGYTLLRNNLYTDLFLVSLGHALATGQLVKATADGAAAYVTRDDCARVAAAALVAKDSGNRVVDVTGPAALTQKELARILTEITGKAITYVPADAAAVKQGMVAGGVPEPIADLYVSFDVAIARGLLAQATSTVRELTGKEPESVASFLARNKSALV